MTDLEMTKLCAEAMGLRYQLNTEKAEYQNAICLYDEGCNLWNHTYAPLWNDAQAMALVKTLELDIMRLSKEWHVFKRISEYSSEGTNADLNCAICECIAKLQISIKVKL